MGRSPKEVASKDMDSLITSEISLESILNRQLHILNRVTKQLSLSSSSGLTKDEIQSLATCIRLTMDLKAKENELLDQLSDEELEKLKEDE